MKKTILLLSLVAFIVQNTFAWGWAVRDAVRQPAESPSYYLGDQITFAWDFNSTSWGAALKKAGIGTTNSAAGMNWQDITWIDDAGDGYGNNEGLQSANFTLTSATTWYYSLWIGFNNTYVGDNGRWYNGNNTWTDGSSTFISSSLTANAIPNPTPTSPFTTTSSSIVLNWTKDTPGHNVMIVRKKSTETWTEPIQGTAYSVSNSIGAGVIIYNGSGTNYTETSLSSSTAYDYKFYSENNSYYSSGVVASATTTTATTDYFRSKTTGNWGYNSTWESSFDNTIWISSTISPGSSANSISILNSHEITIASATTTASLSISSGAILNINPGQALTVGTTLVNNGTLNLLSDQTSGTATILTPATFSGNGTYNVQQYLTSGRNWYISSPVSGATSNAVSASPAFPLYYYDEASYTWPAITNTSTTLGIMTGYIANVASNGAVSFTGGSLNNGSQTITPTRHTGVTKEGFNLVGNPYPSYVNWGAATKTNIMTTMWYRTQNTSSSYVFDTYNATGNIGTNNNQSGAVTAYIPPMQAFWVRVNAGQTSGTLAFDNTMRTHKDVSGNKLKAPAIANTTQQVIRLQVSNGANSDEAILLYNPNASNEFDDYDSPKMTNAIASVPEIYTTVGSEKLVINGLNAVTKDEALPLGFTTGESNNFTIRANEIANFDTDIKIILKDNLLNAEQELTDGSAYSFTSDATTSTSRFSIIFRSAGVTTNTDNKKNDQDIAIFSNAKKKILVNCANGIAGQSNVSVFNAIGQKLVTEVLTSKTTQLNTVFTPGLYLATVKNAGKNTTRKVIIN
jgi:hypothetical protein